MYKISSTGPLRVTIATADTSASAAGEERTSLTFLSVSRQLHQTKYNNCVRLVK